jgi:hypothetical protein
MAYNVAGTHGTGKTLKISINIKIFSPKRVTHAPVSWAYVVSIYKLDEQ